MRIFIIFDRDFWADDSDVERPKTKTVRTLFTVYQPAALTESSKIELNSQSYKVFVR